MIADLMILHRKSGAKSSNQRFLPFLRNGGRGRGMGVFDHETNLGPLNLPQAKKAALEDGNYLDN